MYSCTNITIMLLSANADWDFSLPCGFFQFISDTHGCFCASGPRHRRGSFIIYCLRSVFFPFSRWKKGNSWPVTFSCWLHRPSVAPPNGSPATLAASQKKQRANAPVNTSGIAKWRRFNLSAGIRLRAATFSAGYVSIIPARPPRLPLLFKKQRRKRCPASPLSGNLFWALSSCLMKFHLVAGLNFFFPGAFVWSEKKGMGGAWEGGGCQR